MKQIEKQSEPESFSQWKEIDKMADRPRWNRVPTPIKGVVQDSLMTEQGFICCYCQSSIVKEDSPRISDKGRIGQGSDQDLAELARYTRFSMWKCGSDIIARANRLPTR